MCTPLTVRLLFISCSGVSRGMPAICRTTCTGRRRWPLARFANPNATSLPPGRSSL